MTDINLIGRIKSEWYLMFSLCWLSTWYDVSYVLAMYNLRV